MKNFAIFGKSINYSKSPVIHNLFFKEFNLNYNYFIYECDHFNFKYNLINFLNKNNSFGVNITIPFKEESYNYCNFVSKDSYISKSINTIKKLSNNLFKGYNTDGIGLLLDLKRINFIKKNYKILIIGSGGAAKGIIPKIYKYSSKLVLTSRNIDKSNNLKLYFKKFKINIFVNDINNISEDFNLIINATSSSSKNTIPKISNDLIKKEVRCYDLFYDLKNDTKFVYWCKKNGSKYCSDGLGMLVYQAAYSFYIWNKIMPNVNLILKKIRY